MNNILLFPPISGTLLFFVIALLIVKILSNNSIKPSSNSLYYSSYYFHRTYFIYVSAGFLAYSLIVEYIFRFSAKLGVPSPNYFILSNDFSRESLINNISKAGVEFLFFAIILSLTLFSLVYLNAVLKKFYHASSLPSGTEITSLNKHLYYQPLITSIEQIATKTKEFEQITTQKKYLIELEENNYASSLSVVKWAEVTLPIIGFLGTVLGMKLAMTDINATNEVIEGMKIAFNTTMYGLAGLLIVGIRHLVIKKTLLSRLWEIDQNLSDYINHIDFTHPVKDRNKTEEKEKENIYSALVNQVREIHKCLTEIEKKTPEDNQNQMLQGINQQLQEMQEQLDMVDMQLMETNNRLEDITLSERDTSSVLMYAKDSIEKVIYEVPAFQHIKNTLFYPILEFDDLTTELSLNIQEFLQEFPFYQEEWHFSNAWSASKEDGNSYAIIKTKQEKCLVFQFNFVGNVENYKISSLNFTYKKFLPVPDSDKFIGIDSENQPFLVEIPKHNFTKPENIQTAIEFRIPNRFTYKIIGVSKVEKYGSTFLFLYYLHQTFISVELISLEQLDHSSKPFRNEELKCSEIYAMNEETGTLYIIVNPKEGEQSNYILLILSFELHKKKRKLFELREKINRKILLSPNLKPRKLFVLGKEEILLLDDQGYLHYWKNGLSSFVQLQNDLWDSYPGKDYEIRVGLNGWLAVTLGGLLRMWQIRGQFKLIAYEELSPPTANNNSRKTHYSIKQSVAKTLAISADKKFIFGIQENAKALPVWRFPVIQGDTK